MSFNIVRNDITKMKVDAIVNAANNTLLGGGGVDGSIHRAAGPLLRKECETLGGCRTGEAKATKGYALPAKYVIHTVGPIWQGGMYGEEMLLASCYDRSLALAKQLGCESVAFPLISAGSYGYPRREAVAIAQERILRFLEDNEMEIWLVIYKKESLDVCVELFDEIEEYIDDRYVETHPTGLNRDPRLEMLAGIGRKQAFAAAEANRADREKARPSFDGEVSDQSIEEMLKTADASFSEKLLTLITRSGMKDAECYKKANIDRRLFSKIRTPGYRPSKQTVLSFAIALELSLRETKELLKSAGYALSPSIKGDLIVQYYIERGIYDVFEINKALFSFDQYTLGC